MDSAGYANRIKRHLDFFCMCYPGISGYPTIQRYIPGWISSSQGPGYYPDYPVPKSENWQQMCTIIIKKEGDMCLTKYKNPAVMPALQLRVALAENLQNRQNSAVSLAPCHSILVICGNSATYTPRIGNTRYQVICKHWNTWCDGSSMHLPYACTCRTHMPNARVIAAY
jgi:hypothetical protein